MSMDLKGDVPAENSYFQKFTYYVIPFTNILQMTKL
jgi:hypothetical protein